MKSDRVSLVILVYIGNFLNLPQNWGSPHLPYTLLKNKNVLAISETAHIRSLLGTSFRRPHLKSLRTLSKHNTTTTNHGGAVWPRIQCRHSKEEDKCFFFRKDLCDLMMRWMCVGRQRRRSEGPCDSGSLKWTPCSTSVQMCSTDGGVSSVTVLMFKTFRCIFL